MEKKVYIRFIISIFTIIIFFLLYSKYFQKKEIEIQIIKIEDNDDEEKRIAKIFDIYELVLIRPDRYVYGGIKSMQETSNIIEELEKTFSLKI